MELPVKSTKAYGESSTLMEQHSLLLFSQLSDFSAGAVNFDTITEAPADSLILTTVEEGSLTEIATDGDLNYFQVNILFSWASTVSVLVGGSDSTSVTSFLTLSTSLRSPSKTKLQGISRPP